MAEASVRIVALAGSLRAGSFNRKLLVHGVDALRAAGAEVDVVDLKTLALPVFDADLEADSVPPSAVDLRERLTRAQGLLIVTPEYNNSIPGGLKNAIDWASRPTPAAFRGKVAAIMGATPGGFGTLYSQSHLRQVLVSLSVWVVPESVKVSRAGDAFDASGALKDARTLQFVQGVAAQLVRAAGLLGKGA